jgi:fluoride exporter
MNQIMLNNVIAVCLGGGVGTSLRHLIAFHGKNKFKFTCKSTFFINATGCFTLGLLLGVFKHFQIAANTEIVLFFTMGVIGSFTTFGTFVSENIKLVNDKEIIKSFLYTFLSLFFCLLLLHFGYLVNKIIIG